MPITEFIKRKFSERNNSDIHSDIFVTIKNRAAKSDENWEVVSRELPKFKSIKAIPYQIDFKTIRILVNVTSTTYFEFINDQDVEQRNVDWCHTIEYELHFEEEVRLTFINIGKLRSVEFDLEKQLDSTLLPYMYNHQYEQEAELFLETFYSDFLKEPSPIDPLVAINKLNSLSIRTKIS